MYFWGHDLAVMELEVFTNSTICSITIIHDVYVQVEEIHSVYLALKPIGASLIDKWIGWIPPSSSGFKLNTDGSRKSSRMARADGLIREAQGRCCGAFCMNIVMCLLMQFSARS